MSDAQSMDRVYCPKDNLEVRGLPHRSESRVGSVVQEDEVPRRGL
jgi:hypothetical protein